MWNEYSSPTPPAQQNRTQRISHIKASLKDFALIRKNKTMVEKKLSMQMDSLSQSDSTDGISFEAEDIKSNFQHAQLFAEKYQTTGKLGEGSDGVVHRCIKKKTGKQYAAKAIMFEDEHVPQLRYNYMLMKALAHRNIVKYEALYLDLKKHLCWLVMQLFEAPCLIRAPLCSQNQLKYIIQQLLQTLYYIHQRSVTHRDVKPQNILYDPLTKKLKLIDFGICRKHKRRGITMDMLTITGTLFYRAPEMFSGGGYNQKVDIWAAGVTIFKLVTGSTPFQSQYHRKTIKNIIKEQVSFPQAFDHYSPALKALVYKMLKRNPKERLSALDCLRDPWFYSQTSAPTIPYQIHFCDQPNEQDIEGYKSPFLDSLDQNSHIRKINGDEYHCFDSQDEDNRNHQANLKKGIKSMEFQLNSFQI